MLAAVDPELDLGPRTEKSATRRMCAVSREVRPIEELIRFVVAPTGEVIADLKRKLPGRGLWVTASRQAVAEAVRRHHFSRGFKRDLRVSPSLAADTEALLVRSTTDALGVAAKAGQVVAGFSKVEAALKQRGSRNTVQALIHASDGAEDGIRKLDALLGQNSGQNIEIPGGSMQIPVITVLTSAELDLALTRSNVIHAALLAGPASKTFLSRSQTLVRYRMADADKTAGIGARNSKPHSTSLSRDGDDLQ
ncbi:RNA-binding protein [Bradyrhizobium sp. Tv2a-2]|uniref:RNA-binding protein n=1 Tax=Bradyrhizobium sp. Tv2a-2 TaxID=113395 RepID=UPI0003FFA2BF|nr:RNA-binding protein [Bradyrhizobium sp. Tv2a-2]